MSASGTPCESSSTVSVSGNSTVNGRIVVVPADPLVMTAMLIPPRLGRWRRAGRKPERPAYASRPSSCGVWTRGCLRGSARGSSSGGDQVRPGARQHIRQLPAGVDPELYERVTQMPLNGARAEEEPGTDVRI